MELAQTRQEFAQSMMVWQSGKGAFLHQFALQITMTLSSVNPGKSRVLLGNWRAAIAFSGPSFAPPRPLPILNRRPENGLKAGVDRIGTWRAVQAGSQEETSARPGRFNPCFPPWFCSCLPGSSGGGHTCTQRFTAGRPIREFRPFQKQAQRHPGILEAALAGMP
jgi:hypothetical protein